MTETITPIYRPDPLTLIMLALLALCIGLIVLAWLERFERGELMLTETGCQALAAHGVEAEPLPDATLCRLAAQFERSRRADRFGTIRVEQAGGVIEIELHSGYVVSLSTRSASPHNGRLEP